MPQLWTTDQNSRERLRIFTNAGPAVMSRAYNEREDSWDWGLMTEFHHSYQAFYLGHATRGSAVNHLWKLVLAWEKDQRAYDLNGELS